MASAISCFADSAVEGMARTKDMYTYRKQKTLISIHTGYTTRYDTTLPPPFAQYTVAGSATLLPNVSPNGSPLRPLLALGERRRGWLHKMFRQNRSSGYSFITMNEKLHNKFNFSLTRPLLRFYSFHSTGATINWFAIFVS